LASKLPIIFIVFNRPEVTSKTFDRIKAYQPEKLLIIADGPRETNKTDYVKVNAVRNIVNEINWKCTVHQNYSDKNLGLKNRIESGLDWAFSIVPEAIVLEDDCLVNASFFEFMEFQINKHRHDHKISLVSGSSILREQDNVSNDPYLSKYSHCWGWATWANRWQTYDREMTLWRQFRNTIRFLKIHSNPVEYLYWRVILDRSFNGINNSWAYIWTMTNWYYERYSVAPTVNLVSNIGFDESSTHTINKDHPLNNMSITEQYTYERDIEYKQNKALDALDFNIRFGGSRYRFPVIFKTLFMKLFKSIFK
jgi:hypothetical protein